MRTGYYITLYEKLPSEMGSWNLMCL